MDYLKSIYLNDNYNYLDIIILSYKEKFKSKEDLQELSARLNIPVVLLQGWVPAVEEKKKEIKQKSKMKIFTEMYFNFYARLRNRKPKSMEKGNKKEWGNLKRICDMVEQNEFRQILNICYHKCRILDKGEKFRKWTWNLIVDDITPSKIYSKIDFILAQIDLEKSAKGSGKKFRDDTKDKK